MTAKYIDDDGNECKWNIDTQQWEYIDGDVCIDGKRQRICNRCNKPTIDINGVERVDFCLQGLTDCSFVTEACCGHGDDEAAYIGLADGRRFVLDKSKRGDL